MTNVADIRRRRFSGVGVFDLSDLLCRSSYDQPALDQHIVIRTSSLAQAGGDDFIDNFLHTC